MFEDARSQEIYTLGPTMVLSAVGKLQTYCRRSPPHIAIPLTPIRVHYEQTFQRFNAWIIVHGLCFYASVPKSGVDEREHLAIYAGSRAHQWALPMPTMEPSPDTVSILRFDRWTRDATPVLRHLAILAFEDIRRTVELLKDVPEHAEVTEDFYERMLSRVLSKRKDVPYGCHCDLEPGMTPDGCVMDEGRHADCTSATPGGSKELCPHWRPIQ